MQLLKKKSFHLSLIAGLGVLIYLNSLQVPFYFDDYIQIINVPLVKNLSFFVDPGSAKAFHGYGGFISRFFGYLTFALNYRLHGLNVVGYHVVNLAVHLLAALQVYLLATLTYRTPYFQERSDAEGWTARASFVGLLAGLLFVAHPIQTQAVTYVVQRFASLAALLYLVSLTGYIRGRLIQSEQGTRTPAAFGWFAAALVAAVLAVKTKETSFTLPVTIMLYELLFFTKRAGKKLAAILLAGAVGAAALVMYRLPGGSLEEITSRLDSATRVASDTPRLEYLATQCRVIMTYLRLIFFPVGQRLDYEFEVSHSFLSLDVLPSALFLLALLAAALFLVYWSGKPRPGRETMGAQARLAGFGILWFFITLAIESSLIPIADVIFEHRMYLPAAGLFLALGAVLSQWRGAGSPVAGWPGKPVLAGAVAVVLVLSGLTVARNQLWRDEVAFWQDNAEKSPQKGRVFLNLGRAQERRGDYAGAEKSYRKASAVWPEQTDSVVNLGLLYTQANRLPEAAAQFNAALAVDPKLAEAHNNLGRVYGMQGELDQALSEFNKAVELKPTLAEPYSNIGFVYALRGRYPEALQAYQKCIDLDPDYQQVYLNRAAALLATGRGQEAAADLRRVLEINPNNPEAQEQLQRMR